VRLFDLKENIPPIKLANPTDEITASGRCVLFLFRVMLSL
jgi:hypothetical protein